MKIIERKLNILKSQNCIYSRYANYKKLFGKKIYEVKIIDTTKPEVFRTVNDTSLRHQEPRSRNSATPQWSTGVRTLKTRTRSN